LVPTTAEKWRMKEHGLEPIVEGSAMEKETGYTPEDSKKSDEDAETEDENANQQGQEHVNDNEQQGELTEEELRLHYFPVSVKYSNFTRHHRSLVHLWNEWYQEYMDLKNYPHIMTRMEDLLFFPDQTVPAICECAGGKIISGPSPNSTHIKIIAESAKKKSVRTRPGEEHTGYLDALIRYGNPSTRSRGFTAHDLKYGKHYLDPTLLDLFGYQHPEEDALLTAR
jgi:hypothetical protein